MKRFTRKTLNKFEHIIEYDAYNIIYGLAPRVLDVDTGKELGYITYDLYHTLLKNQEIKPRKTNNYWHALYYIV